MATLGYAYCVLHDMYFADHNDRDRHIQSSDDHPQCHICDRRFKDRNALRNHWIVAKYHYYCVDCNKHFNTAVGLEYHIDEIHVGGDDSDDEDECSDESEHYDGWEDDRGMDRYPDGVPAESQAHKLGVNDDNSWEIWDDLDFEDQEDLMDPSEPSLDDYASNSDDEVDEDDEEHLSHHFECPITPDILVVDVYAYVRNPISRVTPPNSRNDEQTVNEGLLRHYLSASPTISCSEDAKLSYAVRARVSHSLTKTIFYNTNGLRDLKPESLPFHHKETRNHSRSHVLSVDET
ncbi:hypothetical protein HHX47_DHR2001072 [Lentinula edodes]|nr:hypothetical protein HHX47_DHR2001072 [Lentinula edodes]